MPVSPRVAAKATSRSGISSVWTDIWFDNETPQKRHRRWRRLPVRWGQVLRLLDYPGSPEGLQDRARHLRSAHCASWDDPFLGLAREIGSAEGEG